MRGMYVRKKICEIAAPAMMQAADEVPSSRDEEDVYKRQLVDSGGQYKDGTTDITRTIVLGPLTGQMKEDYTTILKSNLTLSMAKFAKGTTGTQLDETARRPVRDRGLDFDHGTGHGVGHILSVHEGPNNISPRNGSWPITPGMITTCLLYTSRCV